LGAPSTNTTLPLSGLSAIPKPCPPSKSPQTNPPHDPAPALPPAVAADDLICGPRRRAPVARHLGGHASGPCDGRSGNRRLPLRLRLGRALRGLHVHRRAAFGEGDLYAVEVARDDRVLKHRPRFVAQLTAAVAGRDVRQG